MRAYLALPLALLLACSKHEEPTALKPTPSVSAAPSATPRVTELASKLHPDLLDPSKANETAPAVFSARFDTSAGHFIIEAHRDWAPLAADRFYNLVKMGFYDNQRFHRVVSGFLVQFGISGDPAVSAKWAHATLADEPPRQSNFSGFVSFAKSNQPNSRDTQVFINLNDNLQLDKAGYAPFGKVMKGMDVIGSLFAAYGESRESGGQGPNPFVALGAGNAYLDEEFPKLSTLVHAEIVQP